MILFLFLIPLILFLGVIIVGLRGAYLRLLVNICKQLPSHPSFLKKLFSLPNGADTIPYIEKQNVIIQKHWDLGMRLMEGAGITVFLLNLFL